MRDGMVFYASFWEAVKDLPDEQFKLAVKAIIEYGLYEKEPETTGIERTVFILSKPQIDANNKRYQNGTKGGRPKTKEEPDINQTITKPEPNSNQEQTKQEPKDKVKEKEKEKDKVKEKDIKSGKTCRFIPPTKQDIDSYCADHGYCVDAERFIDFYESKGWMVGSNKMKDWKAAVRNWSRSQRQESTAKVKKTGFSNAPERDYDMSDLARQLIE